MSPIKTFLLLLAAGPVLMSTGCSRPLLGGSAGEGSIEYAISFPGMDPDGLMADILPTKAVLSFDQEHQSLDLSAGMGIFKTSMVVNTPKKVVDYHMSIMGKSLVASMGRRDLQELNGTPPSLAMIQTQARDTIAGLPCRQAYLVYDAIGTPEAEVWFTEDIGIDSPNWYGPYGEVPGMLMRFELVQNNVRMRLEATKVHLGKVDPLLFADRANHQRVSPEVLRAQLDEVLGAFSH